MNTCHHIAVLGGGFGAVSAACRLAEMGHTVTLVHPLATLGGDVTASYHAWMDNGSTGEPLPLPVGATKKALYTRLADAGVAPLLLTHCAGIALEADRACGLLLAHAFGVSYLPVDAVVDATEGQLAARHLGLAEAPRHVTVEYTVDAEGMDRLPVSSLPVPASFGLIGDRVLLHATLREQTAGITLRFAAEMPQGPGGRTALELAAHDKAIMTAAWLRERAPFCEALEVAQLATQARVIATAEHTPGLPDNVLALPAVLPLDFTTSDVQALETIAADAMPAFAGRCAPAAALSRTICSHGRKLRDVSFPEAGAEGLPEGLRPCAFDAQAQGFDAVHAQAVVAGGGTGGAMAAWALTSEGVSTALLEQSFFFGGTNTIGFVAGNWHGYTGGMWAQRLEAAKAMDCPASHRIRTIRLWEKTLDSPGNTLLLGMTVCGAVAEGSRVRGALAYGESGFVVVTGEQVIDGTAESSLAVFAGAPYDVGGARDGFVQTSSMWGIDPRRFSFFHNNHYAMDVDVVRPGDFADLLRAVGLAHRFNSDYLFSDLYTVREGRRIRGDYVLSMLDIAHRACFPDTIAVALCTHDTHGRPNSLFNTLSLFSKDMSETGEVDIRVRLPLRVFLPKGLDGIAVVGKCISGEREAVSLCRMNPDVSNAGYAVGLCCAHALRQGVSLREVKLDGARETLRLAGVLPDWADVPANRVTPAWADSLLGDPANGGFLAMTLPEAEALPLLLPALADGGVRGGNAAMALAWFRRPEAAATLARLLREAEDRDIRAFAPEGPYDLQAIRMDGFSRIVTNVNAYGQVKVLLEDPDFSYAHINQWLVLLAMTGDVETALPAILPYAARADSGGAPVPGKTPYSHARRDTHHVPFDSRLWSLALALERLGDSRAIPALERMLALPNVQYPVCTERFAPVPPVLCTYLEIGIARALARCGGLKGAERLAAYAADCRQVFATMAQEALEALTGARHGRDTSAWLATLRTMAPLQARPYAGDPLA